MEQTNETFFDRLGGEAGVRKLAERFYDVMDEREPALAALHKKDENGKVSRESRDRFGLFLVGWLGGPQEYMRVHGHPRLRMRHFPFPVNTEMKDAWVRCMTTALEEQLPPGISRDSLVQRFRDVADFLRNQPE